MPKHLENVQTHAEKRLQVPKGEPHKGRAELLGLYKRFLKIEEHRIRLKHHAGASGLDVAGQRAELLDIVLENLFTQALAWSDTAESNPTEVPPPVSLIATGGYGRKLLNPGSDVDLLFLHPAGRSPSKEAHEIIEQILYMLWDVGFKVGYAVRSIKETLLQANKDNKTKSSLIESRFITGDLALFEQFWRRFLRTCIEGRQQEYLALRKEDIKARREKYKTVYLQEPNVKSGCGGLRDYHNLIWVSFLEYGEADPKILVKKRILTNTDYREIQRAYDFLHRVRNELHYESNRANDILTLRLQGVVATHFGYSNRNILRRVEEFMRDYYMHTRNLYLQSRKVMERLQLAYDEELESGLISFLARRRKNREYFGKFYSWNNRIYARDPDVFSETPYRLMRVFQHVQQRHLQLSPQISELIEANRHLMGRDFRYDKKTRNIFEAILSRRGEVAEVLKLMHRVDVLGHYLPEFGALRCLVQHEFFHRYTADHHTLVCLQRLDELTGTQEPKLIFFRDLFHAVEDPVALYLSFLLHDTGRAENVRYHSDASAVLASRVCRRLQIRGERRRLILFLVDSHLTMWRTATTKNIEDPAVIEEFAQVVRNKRNLDALFLFTYADSKATNEDGWNDWKETLMMQLYRATLMYWEGHQAFKVQADKRLARLKSDVLRQVDPELHDEVEVHFSGMPIRYFNFREPDVIARHLRLIRTLRQTEEKSPGELVTPVVRWTDYPEASFSEFIACSRNRPLLLARLAGVLAAHEINILSADIFSREDGVVLDSFRVCTTNFEPVTLPSVRQGIKRLLEDVFKDVDYDFGPLIRKARRKTFAEWPEAKVFPQRVYISNSQLYDATLVEIQAVDRLGLLYDFYSTIGRLGLDVTHSRIMTEKGAAIDALYVTTGKGRRIEDPLVLEVLQHQLEEVIAIPGAVV